MDDELNQNENQHGEGISIITDADTQIDQGWYRNQPIWEPNCAQNQATGTGGTVACFFGQFKSPKRTPRIQKDRQNGHRGPQTSLKWAKAAPNEAKMGTQRGQEGRVSRYAG